MPTASPDADGGYKVYAKWPASSQHATDVPYSVTHAGGTSTVTVNQRVNGGKWNLLGTYTFNSGTNYKVELSDAVAAGKVAADAIYIVSAAAPAAAFTWTPAIRVEQAIALVMQPRVLLLDEPLAALDLKLRQAMQEQLRRIHQQVGGTFRVRDPRPERGARPRQPAARSANRGCIIRIEAGFGRRVLTRRPRAASVA